MTLHTMTLCKQRKIAAGDSSVKWLLPNSPIEFGMFRRVTFQLTVTETGGSPTNWSFAAKLQVGMENRRGGPFTDAPTYRDFNLQEIAQHCAGNVIRYGFNVPPTVFTDVDTVSKIAQITVEQPPNLLRLSITPSFTGGTSPYLGITALALCELD